QIGRFGSGTLNIADGGNVSVVNLTVVNADGAGSDSKINNSNGSFVSNTVINQVGGEILGNGSFTALGGWSNFGFMAFRGGTSNIYGPVTNLAGGRIFGEFFGITTFHGDVVHNGAQIAVGQGSRIEFLGTVSGAGNYFSNGVVAMRGGFRPGNNTTSVVSVARDLEFGAGTTTFMDLGGVNPGQFDQLHVGGSASLGGSQLDVSLFGGYTPSPGHSFSIMSATGGVTGVFGSVVEPSMANQLRMEVVYSPTLVRLSFLPSGDFNGQGGFNCLDINALVAHVASGGTSPAFDMNGDGLVNPADVTVWLAEAGAENLASGNPYRPGDANLDGVVDGSDFGIWNSNKFTSVAAWCSGDFSADGVVDGSDFGIWNSNKFTSSDSGQSVIPEPTFGLAGSLAFALLYARRRKSVDLSPSRTF
ncbi:MAG TPA: hypothetical protein VIY86_08945, partial [Pirellulaceae bacterium]